MSTINELLSKVQNHDFVGNCPAFRECISMIERFSQCRSPILIKGETGTGKELAARALHYLGPRKDHPFIPLNCGSLPDTMFENELFGHKQGAYTDAKNNQHGLIAQANKGTLFLDEVDSLSLHSQASLLRFLQDQKYRPLGETEFIQADVSIISATNAKIDNNVSSNSFRQDLLFRLETISISLPPLRERGEDIVLIATHFLYYLSELYEQPIKKLHPNLLQWIEQQEWQGNIRELQSFLHREFLLADGDTLLYRENLNQKMQDATPQVKLDQTCFQIGYDEMKRRVLKDFDYQYLDNLMKKTKGNISQAARIIKKDRRSLGRLLEKNHIDRNNYS